MWNSIETPQNEIAHCVSHTHNAFFFFFFSLFVVVAAVAADRFFFFLFVLLKLSPFHFSNQARDGRKRKGVTKIQKKKRKKNPLVKECNSLSRYSLSKSIYATQTHAHKHT